MSGHEGAASGCSSKLCYIKKTKQKMPVAETLPSDFETITACSIFNHSTGRTATARKNNSRAKRSFFKAAPG